VCFAAPTPPEKSISILIEEIGIFQSQGDFAVKTIKVKEVAFAYLGNGLDGYKDTTK
jgi:hypothetical protein